MQHELEELQPQLLKMAKENVIAETKHDQMAKENVEMMQFIDRQSQEMEYNSEVVRAEEVVAKRQAAAAQALKDECEAELAEAVPALEAAIAALNTLKVWMCIVVAVPALTVWRGQWGTKGLRRGGGHRKKIVCHMFRYAVFFTSTHNH